MSSFNSKRLIYVACGVIYFLISGQLNLATAQQTSYQLEWIPNAEASNGGRPAFKGATFLTDAPHLPVWQKFYEGNPGTAVLENAVYEPVKLSEFHKSLLKSDQSQIKTESVTERKQSAAVVTIFPYRLSGAGEVDRLVSFTLRFSGTLARPVQPISRVQNAGSSVLSSGNWYKIGVTADGVYRLNYSDLLNMGFAPEDLSLQSIRLYGNGGGMLPLLNSAARTDDLLENAIQVRDVDNNGVFNNGDFVLFYGQSQTRWTYNTIEKRYLHQRNFYSDTTFYFLTTDLGTSGKRIPEIPSEQPGGFVTVNTFQDYAFRENDNQNFIKSGRNWYGEAFDVNLNQKISFGFPNLVPGTASIKSSVVSRTAVSTFGVFSYFVIRHNGTTVLTQQIQNVGTNYTDDFGRAVVNSGSLNVSGNEIVLDYTYQPYNSSSTGWLDYVSVNARRYLQMNGNSMFFREQDTTANLLQRFFQLTIPFPGIEIWDVSTQDNVRKQQYNSNGNIAEFYKTIAANAKAEFLAFTLQGVLTPIMIGKIENQNLHALPQADYIIITHPDFIYQAERLADFHRNHDSLRTVVATTREIYNEFSSGAQDVAALRDFIRMFYTRAQTPADLPQYVLLFGDGSYDMKNRTASNTNFVPTFQSDNSLSLLASYTCDDFFGLMDPFEGTLNNAEIVDIGIGRLPVKNQTEAKDMVDKVIIYSTPGSANEVVCGNTGTRFGDWRNVLCFIADDQDRNLHFRQSERIINIVSQSHPQYNIDKIVCDAYQQITTPGGQRYPDVNDAIDKRIEKGAFLLNYTGHGGELGWAAESILNNDMIRNWTNINALPAFITATCEFSRFDDPYRTSAGEYVLLNRNGGGICLFTTIRLAFAIDNELINADMIEHLFDPINGKMPRTGDVIRLSKRDNPGNRNVTLLGDPALKLAYPKYRVTTSSILNTSTGLPEDTLSALSRITVQGAVTDGNGNTLTGFNGVVYPVIYDKNSVVRTLVNDPTGSDISLPDSFRVRRNILYKGKASVTNGVFSSDFIIPKDIAYQYGNGRLSYYAHNDTDDANGMDESFIIGGSSAAALNDQDGPQIELYINNEQFVFGGLTDDTPEIFALLKDSSGINTVGNGIGHDITAQLNGESQKVFVLNDYYEADLNSYQTGKVRYTLAKMVEGRHTLTFKAWDINNNSSEKTTEFIVASSEKMALAHVLNYPNPFTTHTSFFFEHNRPCEGITIQVQVFTVSGRLVKTLEGFSLCNGTRESGLTWDGRDDFGDPLARGVYVYRLKVRAPDGDAAEKLEKLVLLR